MPTEPQPEIRDARTARLLAVVATGVYTAVGLWFVFGGLMNGDEGWYLYTSRLVYRGALPYADFTFTQMPLVAYVYGLPQLLISGLYCGRLTSLLLAVAALVVSARAASKLAGPAAGAAVCVLLAAAPSAIYFSTLVKTYALTALFLAALFASLTGSRRREIADPLATAVAFGLALTRASGVPIALAVALGCAWTAPDTRTRGRTLAVTALGSCLIAFFVLTDFEAARFNLSEFHGVWWYGMPLSGRIRLIALDRIPAFLMDYAAYWALFCGAVGAATLTSSGRELIRREPGLAAVSAAMLFFLSTHLLPGQFSSVEYFVAVIPVWLGLCSAVLFRVARSSLSRGRATAVSAGVVTVVAAISLAHPSVARYAVGPSQPGSIAAVNDVARFVREHTRPDDEILTLWNQAVSVAADRDTVPGISLGIFSYSARPQPEADSLHLLTRKELRRMLVERRPAAVVLSTTDFDQLRKAGTLSKIRLDPAPLQRVLSANYERRFVGPGHGLFEPEPVSVYLRRDAPRREASESLPEAAKARADEKP